MIIAITGSNGFLGRRIKTYFIKKGMKVISLPREILYNKHAMAKQLHGVDAIIHVAGFPIAKRWTSSNKIKIYDSRASTTQNIVEAVNKMDHPPSIIISTSAIGIYNNIHYHDEESEDYSNRFLGKVCIAWEAPFDQLNTESSRMIITRLGVVIGNGGMVKKLMNIFKLGIGGKIGHGEFAMPFIHIEDLLRFYDTALANENYEGIYNLVAPDIITNEDFTKAMAKCSNKKAKLTIPIFALKLLMGKGIMSVINNPFVIPKRLLEAGFVFKYDQIEDALKQVFNEKSSKT